MTQDLYSSIVQVFYIRDPLPAGNQLSVAPVTTAARNEGFMADDNPITFKCAVEKVQTMADGALRVWVSLPETELFAAAQLMACQTHGVYLKAVLTPVEPAADDAPHSGDYWDENK